MKVCPVLPEESCLLFTSQSWSQPLKVCIAKYVFLKLSDSWELPPHRGISWCQSLFGGVVPSSHQILLLEWEVLLINFWQS